MLRTRNKGTWAVPLKSFESVRGTKMTLSAAKSYAIFEPAFPYVYMPVGDYIRWMKTISTQYKDKQINCNPLSGTKCYFANSCDHVRNFV